MAGGHSIDDPEPKYGMAVTGIADPAAVLRIDAGILLRLRPRRPVLGREVSLARGRCLSGWNANLT